MPETFGPQLAPQTVSDWKIALSEKQATPASSGEQSSPEPELPIVSDTFHSIRS